jgi:hypothetical protein
MLPSTVKSIWNSLIELSISAIWEHRLGQVPLTRISTGKGEPIPGTTSTLSTIKGWVSRADGADASPGEVVIAAGEQEVRRNIKDIRINRGRVFMVVPFYDVEKSTLF